MFAMLRPALMFAALSLSAPLLAAPPLPEPVREMVEAAARSGDAARRDAVVAVARQTNPDSRQEIDQIVASIRQEQERQHREELVEASFLQHWNGSGEIGGSKATGNSDTVTLAVGLNLVRDGLKVRHSVNALADVQRNDGENSQERYALSYQADLRLSDRFYVLGRTGWERNRVAGLKSRFSEGLGVGYKVLTGKPFNWELEGGPTLRQTDFYDRHENGVAWRMASNFGWQIAPTSRFTQTTTGLAEQGNNSIISTTALTSSLWGPFSARMSFNLQYESNPPDDLRHTDTVTRMTLVYEFGNK